MRRVIYQGVQVGDVTDVPVPDGAPESVQGAKTIDLIHGDNAEILSFLLPASEVEELQRGLSGEGKPKIQTFATMPPTPPER